MSRTPTTPAKATKSKAPAARTATTTPTTPTASTMPTVRTGSIGSSSTGASVSRLLNRGNLPHPPPRFAVTPVFTELTPKLVHNTRRGTIMAVSGPVGIGKTTAVAQALRNLSHRAVWVQMSTNLSARGHMADIWQALTGTPAVGDLRRTRDDIIEYLCDTEVVLAMDDAHFINASGLVTLVNIWNEVHATRGRGVPMVATGNGLLNKLASTPSVLSRVGPRVDALPLHGDTLLRVLTDIEPRFGVTDTDMLFDIDRRYFKGELRQWNEFIEATRYTTHPADAPISGTEAAGALTLLGFVAPTPIPTSGTTP